MDEFLEHYGTPRHSGRYPWGSGDNPYQHDSSAFMSAVNKMKKDGLSQKEQATLMGISIAELRARISYADEAVKYHQQSEAWRLHNEMGYGATQIGRIMGISESTVRGMLQRPLEMQKTSYNAIGKVLEDEIARKGYIDVGKGTETYLGISKQKLDNTIKLLKDQGYQEFYYKYTQLGTGLDTSVRALVPPGVTYKQFYEDVKSGKKKIEVIDGAPTSKDLGLTFEPELPIRSVSPDRVAVRYAEEGGKDMDGVIQLRPGVADISLGDAKYAQVRILVGEDTYLKGMAVYSDDLPDGVDMMFNTNKHSSVPKMEVLKGTKDDEDNPFGATVKQVTYVDENGVTQRSALNIVRQEGEWDTWSNTIASQVLSKQPAALAKKQLQKAYKDKKEEFDEIMALTNPTVKQQLLQEFADGCDGDAVHLKAAAMPRQSWKVILPVTQMSETEVYAPSYENGEQVVLIRYPHGGIFEIPSLTVNNNNPHAKKLLGNATDAIGINAKVAEQLSGADFDGDTVLVIPNNDGAIKTSRPLDELVNFDPKERYQIPKDVMEIGPRTGFIKGTEMGKATNLITDMTLQGATQEEIAAAVRYSMVVIDAEKHNLDWRRAYSENSIATLKEKYQGGPNAGASTIVSKASSQAYDAQRKQGYQIDPETGERIWRYTGKTYTPVKRDETGAVVSIGKETASRTKTTKMDLVSDAYDLVRDPANKIEIAYATYANQMKALANQARKALIETPNLVYSPSAAKTYSSEAASLNAKLNIARKNAPLERQAQMQASVVVAAKKKANPNMDADQVKRLKGQELERARKRVGASGSKTKIQVTPKEWEAIQAGAIHHSKLKEILSKANMDVIRSYATPRKTVSVTDVDAKRIRTMMNSGKYTQAEVASQLGVSVSTIYQVLKEN